jgi:hypothetical protein
MTSWTDQLLKSTTVAGTTTAAMYLAANDSANVSISGIPLGVLVGILNGVTNAGSKLAHDYVLPHIPYNQRFADAEAFALNGGIAFAGAPGMLYLNGTITDMNDAIKLGLISLSGDILGDYIYEHAIHGMLFPNTFRNARKGKARRLKVR